MKDIQYHDIIPLLIVVGLLVAPAAAPMTQHAVVTTFAGSDTKIGSGLIYPYPGIIWGPYLSGTTSTDTVVNVKTTEPVTVTVEYATDIYYKACASYDQNITDGTTDMLHHVSLTGLEPDTLYHYRVMYDGQATGDLHFRTFPESGPVTFVVYSDTQDQLPTFSQLERHKIVADRIAEEPDIAFVLNSGDLVNNATNLSDWDRYFAAGSMMMANTTVFPALGNHDRYDPYYSAIYGVPEYYSFDCADVHVTMLNSNDWAWPDLPTQSAWLAADLQTEKPFKFVSFHHPIFSSDYKHFGGWENLRLEWEDDFNENGVLAVFNGHVHAYERLVVNDTTYFVAGIGGGPSYNLADPRYEASVSSLEYIIGYTRVTIDPVARTATAEVIRVADVSSDLKTLTMVYPPNTIFETVVMALPVPPITVESPNGGEKWHLGSTQTIQWSYNGDLGSTVKIEALRGEAIIATIPSVSIGSGGSGTFNLTVPFNTPVGDNYRFRVTSISNPGYTDTSDAPFTISPDSSSSITLVSPNGGNVWTQGSTQFVNWTYAGNPGSSLKIEFLKGSDVLKTLTGIPTSSGSVSVPVPYSTPPGDDYRVRITSTSNPAYTDTSEDSFTVQSTISIVSPNGGEVWQQGSEQIIQWSYTENPGSAVKIEALRGDSILAVIISSTPVGTEGTGLYTLLVPNNTPLGSDYRVRVTSTTSTACTDTSEMTFFIVAG
ncbi:MAG TPA: Ser-Thr-rich GPI-anchored membrane family protein [Methanoregulaceae archaeon]|nr:Ser-Thr-rich GPI-anchored membrane family protein [Methanoregulaceae archaeon]